MKTLVIAPHADDELIGCGGTLLRRVAEGGTVGWILMTAMSQEAGWAPTAIAKRELEIEKVRLGLGVQQENFFTLGFCATRLDVVPLSSLVSKINDVFNLFTPQEVLLPYPGDVHSDHRIGFEAASACTKSFRHPSVRRILAYETLSETNFIVDPRDHGFNPNFFIDIGHFLDRKISLFNTYESEVGEFPFPRSERAVRSLAEIRGVQAGVEAAEGFMLLREFQ